jgi:hypothetical protein
MFTRATLEFLMSAFTRREDVAAVVGLSDALSDYTASPLYVYMQYPMSLYFISLPHPIYDFTLCVTPTHIQDPNPKSNPYPNPNPNSNPNPNPNPNIRPVPPFHTLCKPNHIQEMGAGFKRERDVAQAKAAEVLFPLGLGLGLGSGLGLGCWESYSNVALPVRVRVRVRRGTGEGGRGTFPFRVRVRVRVRVLGILL